ncbi:hypothetical protein GCM10027290_18870 [Micromonospora sonneratiae]|uniref:Peptide zinc metalloprotease protein n=1 Tax=Micromonospora sonneratiae TaxID=1184706 RepID=A0ABW3Y897_9ACTN
MTATEATTAEPTPDPPAELPATVWSRPRLRPEIVLGPGQRKGDVVIHHVLDPVTGWFYRVGPREHFLMSRLDGQHGLDEIAEEYLAVFDRRLGPQNWQQLFTMLHRRQLLDGATDERSLAKLAETAAAGAARAKRGPLQARFPLFDPGRLFGRVHPWLAPLFSQWFVAPALLAVLALDGYVAYDWRRLTEAVGESRQGWLPFLAAIVIAWAIIFLHECAHGLTCWHFGGRVKEIGVMWRFPMLAPYCKVDDVVLLPPAQRVATAFAGVFVSLLALLPFAAVWALAADGGTAHRLSGAVLLFGTVTALLNLVPFLRLDGYYMLTHALNLSDLRSETYQFYRRLVRGGPKTVAGYQVRDRIAYAVYGFANVAFAVVICTLLARFWYASMREWIGAGWAVTVLVVEAVLLVLLVWYGVRRAERLNAKSG